MLTCLLNNQRIDCYSGKFSRDELKKWASKRILLCPACGKPYEYCHGKVKTPYFRHMDKAECEDRFSESETEEHMIGKRDLYEWIKKQKYVTDCVLEGWLSETKQRPDIMFKYKGQVCVIEYQCSPIASEYIERHNLYHAAGIKDIWVAGIEKYKQSNMRHKFLEDYIEGYYDVKTKEFWIGEKTEQGEFIGKVHGNYKRILNSFVFIDLSIIHKNYIKKNFNELYELHISRICNREQNKQATYFKKLEIIEKYLCDFDSLRFRGISRKLCVLDDKNYRYKYVVLYYAAYSYYTRCYEWFELPNSKIIINNQFYLNLQEKIKDLKILKKAEENLRHKLYVIFKDTPNWTFNTYIKYSQNLIGVQLTLFDYFSTNGTLLPSLDYNDFYLKYHLEQIMIKCYKKGLKGNENLRIMEVRED